MRAHYTDGDMDGSGNRDDAANEVDSGIEGNQADSGDSGSSGDRGDSGGKTAADTGAADRGAPDTRGAKASGAARDATLYFFPDREVTAAELRRLLDEGPAEERAWAISHLLRYAQWDDIWTYVSRDEVREVFPDLDLPDNLRQAWGRMLKVEAEVGTPG